MVAVLLNILSQYWNNYREPHSFYNILKRPSFQYKVPSCKHEGYPCMLSDWGWHLILLFLESKLPQGKHNVLYSSLYFIAQNIFNRCLLDNKTSNMKNNFSKHNLFQNYLGHKLYKTVHFEDLTLASLVYYCLIFQGRTI